MQSAGRLHRYNFLIFLCIPSNFIIFLKHIQYLCLQKEIPTNRTNFRKIPFLKKIFLTKRQPTNETKNTNAKLKTFALSIQSRWRHKLPSGKFHEIFYLYCCKQSHHFINIVVSMGWTYKIISDMYIKKQILITRLQFFGTNILSKPRCTYLDRIQDIFTRNKRACELCQQ